MTITEKAAKKLVKKLKPLQEQVFLSQYLLDLPPESDVELPTLRQLITICGDNVHHIYQGNVGGKKDGWVITSNKFITAEHYDTDGTHRFAGDTLYEAFVGLVLFLIQRKKI